MRNALKSISTILNGGKNVSSSSFVEFIRMWPQAVLNDQRSQIVSYLGSSCSNGAGSGLQAAAGLKP